MDVVLTLLAIGLPFVVIGFFICYCIDGENWMILTTIILGLIWLGATAVCIKAGREINEAAWERNEAYVTHKIIALSDGNEMNGRLHRGVYCSSGYINEEFMYVYGYETVSGGMKIQKALAKYATVYFDDTISPQAKWYHEERSWWFFSEERTTCDIYVPSDSLQAGITIDLQ